MNLKQLHFLFILNNVKVPHYIAYNTLIGLLDQNAFVKFEEYNVAIFAKSFQIKYNGLNQILIII